MSIEIQATTPLMLQYQEIKKNFPDALLLFQVGDFYEFFYDDAKKAAAFLAITLTARGKNNGDPIPLCGVPVHAAEFYIAKLVKGGFKVALCNQLEPAVQGRVVERGVAQVFTPGTLVDSHLLDEKSASYLFSFFPLEHSWGLLFAELMTAQLFATMLLPQSEKTLLAELGRFTPDEIIIPDLKTAKPFESFFAKSGFYTTITSYNENQTESQHWIEKQFPLETQKNINCHEAVRLSLAIFHNFLKKNQEQSLTQFNSLTYYNPEDFLLLDAATQRNLELVRNMQDGSRKNSLYEHLDHAVTAMGSRTIKKWILRPLIKKEPIIARQDVIQKFATDLHVSQTLSKLLSEIGDVERIVGRIMLRKAVLQDFNTLAHALETIPHIQNLVAPFQDSVLLQRIVQQLGNFSTLLSLLAAAFNTDVTRDWIIKKGFNQQLDHLRTLVDESTSVLHELELREQQKTGINSLKVRYNNLYGYYIEITKANTHLVPDYFIRAQSLASRDRFTTTELKAIEAEILVARSQITHLEKEILEHVKSDVMRYSADLRKMAVALAQLDALFGLSQVAYQYGYCKPQIAEHNHIVIKDGKHPVIAQHLKNNFIVNSVEITPEKLFWIITGPNMGGKSTFLRQVALITIMAQIGSFVPAQAATISVRDRIFTRIGAGDNVAQGKSTFLLEMEETSTICQQATEKSLIILDEIGRGTSTFDGLAIAQAVVEYLYTYIKAPCLFATHYHELTALQEQFAGIACYHAASKRIQDGILLLHKIEAGVADGSFGIEVAKLAQLPAIVVKRAQEIVELLDTHQQTHTTTHTSFSETELIKQNKELQQKITLLEQEMIHLKKISETFLTIDFNDLSPKKAFDMLWELKK